MKETVSTSDQITTHRLDNGLTIVVQPMPWLRTAAFSLLLRAGINAEAETQGGLASLVCEMVQRGAGSHNSRDLVSEQDNLGIDRHSSVSTGTVAFGAAMPAESLPDAIGLYADIVRRPHLPSDQLDDARLMALQELRAIEDEPTQRVMRRLRELQYGKRLGCSSLGTVESLQAVTQSDIRDFYTSRYHAGGAVLALAGLLETERVIELAEQAFGNWKGGAAPPLAAASGKSQYEHFEAASSQTHIGFSFDSIPYGHDDYFRMRAGIGILSDGMSSRLFDRVREKRGLCYSVSAGCHSLPNSAAVFGYAGTTPDRAQETLDVTLHEIEHLVDDVDTGELERWKVRIQSQLIMEQESSASRASSLASDLYQVGRIITTEELEARIDALTLDEVREYWQTNPPANYRLATLGSNPLQTPAPVAT